MSVWSEATLRRADEIVSRYPHPRSAVMPLLYLAMFEEGHLTDAGIRQVAERTGLTSVQVEAVASFYTMYKRHVGRHLVSVCISISCHLLGADDVLAEAADAAGVAIGDTTDDGSLTVEGVECIGACGGAPAVQVDYETIEGVTPEQGGALCRWLIDESPDSVSGDDLQERFGGVRSFDWGPSDPTTAGKPVPAFGRYGTAGGS
jgi:NADH-quinone oxidoreductase subunit E